VQIALPGGGLDAYKSKSQRARIATESWAESNLFCPNCSSPELISAEVGTPVIDFTCPKCAATYQLKSQSSAFSGRIVDAAYSSMVRAIMEDRTPNLYALHYRLAGWQVANVILIPRFAFPLSAIEKRKPLAATARRAGWVGCNILLQAIPEDARIKIVSDGKPVAPAVVRAQYARVRPLAKIKAEQRGWTLDVLNVVRSLKKPEFDLADVYKADAKLAKLHPANRHVRDKIRQQLQVLRDLGILTFLGGGEYRLG
jgi:type II restriction enzyme